MAGTYFIRHAKERNYTVLDNTFLKDVRLSWKAKGLFAYILSLPEDWKIYTTELQNHATDGETALRAAIKELTEYGYIQQQREKDEKGRWASYSYVIIENPLVENPNVGNPNVGKHGLLNTNNTNNLNKQNTKTLSKDNVTQNSLIPVVSKKTKKSGDIKTMRSMISNFTQNEDIREKLLEYFEIRLKKGLQPNQWQIILDDLRSFAGDDANIAVDKINGAIAGGYMQIIAAWEKDKKLNISKPKFDNTAGRKVDAAINMSEDEFESTLAKNEDGSLMEF